MKKRVCKKVAKRYLDKGIMPKRYILAIEEMADGVYTKTFMVLRSANLERTIRNVAYRRGWDGCHWDDPMVLSVEAEC